MVWGVGVTTLDEVGSTEKLGETQIWPLGHCRYFWILALLHAPCRQQQNMQCQKSSFCLGGQSENVICWGGSSSQKVAVTLSKFIPQDGLSNPNGDGSWVQSLWFWHVSGGLKYNQCGVSKMADLFFNITLRWLYYYTLIVSYCWLMCDVQQWEVNALKHIEAARCVSSHVWPPCFIMPSYQVVFFMWSRSMCQPISTQSKCEWFWGV